MPRELMVGVNQW